MFLFLYGEIVMPTCMLKSESWWLQDTDFWQSPKLICKRGRMAFFLIKIIIISNFKILLHWFTFLIPLKSFQIIFTTSRWSSKLKYVAILISFSMSGS